MPLVKSEPAITRADNEEMVEGILWDTSDVFWGNRLVGILWTTQREYWRTHWVQYRLHQFLCGLQCHKRRVTKGIKVILNAMNRAFSVRSSEQYSETWKLKSRKLRKNTGNQSGKNSRTALERSGVTWGSSVVSFWLVTEELRVAWTDSLICSVTDFTQWFMPILQATHLLFASNYNPHHQKKVMNRTWSIIEHF